MDVRHYLRVAPFINNCPNCNSEVVGNGEGTFDVKENIIKRTCKCGFEFKMDVNGGTSKPKIKKAIDEALKAM